MIAAALISPDSGLWADAAGGALTLALVALVPAVVRVVPPWRAWWSAEWRSWTESDDAARVLRNQKENR